MDRRIQHVLRYLQQNCHRRWRLRDLASSVNLSPTRFSHLFHSETGLPLREYIKRLRLDKAKQLLATTFLRVKEISNQVGYGS
ncbi:MAG: AraC family transcriptional regulator [Acidobacteriia bacterium]|nr:AraC family transcriptional regulator [Terriglobia bacterium]